MLSGELAIEVPSLSSTVPAPSQVFPLSRVYYDVTLQVGVHPQPLWEGLSLGASEVSNQKLPGPSGAEGCSGHC